MSRISSRRLALGDDLQVRGLDARVVAGLDQEAAGHALEGVAGRQRVGQAAGDQQAQVLLGGEHGDGVVVGVGGDDHLGEDLDHLQRGRLGQARLTATMPPKAEVGSQARARS
jgi:hypothetical protein